MIEAVLEKIDNMLKRANFETFILDSFSNKKSKFCFDLLVKKNDLVFSVKIFSNIDNLNADIINDVKYNDSETFIIKTIKKAIII